MRGGERLGEMVVHAAVGELVLLVVEGASRECDDGDVPCGAVGGLLDAPDLLRGLKAVQHRHVTIHQDEVVMFLLVEFDRLFSVPRQIAFASQFRKEFSDEELVGQHVLGDEDSQTGRKTPDRFDP